MKQIRRHVTYANVMSSLAVFLILGGATAFAAVQKIGANEIKANSIKTGKIVKEAVTAGKIKSGAVTESRLADGAVTTNKLADNAVTTGKIANDAVTTAKIANDAVTGAKVNEATLGEVPNAANAQKLGGLPPSAFTPRAFAEVVGGNVVATKPSLNITDAQVSSPSAGITCFSGLDFEVRGAVATARYDNIDDDEIVHVQVGTVAPCPAGTQLSASTFDPGNPGLEGEGFTILFF